MILTFGPSCYKTDLNEDTNNHYVSGIEIVDGSGINGAGFVIDLGDVYQLNDDCNLSTSSIDLGFINWKNNCWLLLMKKNPLLPMSIFLM